MTSAEEDILTSCRPYVDFYLPRVEANEEGLVKLVLVGRYVDDANFLTLVKALVGNTWVEELDFSGNLLTDVAAEAVLKYLSGKKIVKLILDDNKLTDTGCEAIRKYLEATDSTVTCSAICPDTTQPSIDAVTSAAKLNTLPKKVKTAILSLSPGVGEPPTVIDVSTEDPDAFSLEGLTWLCNMLEKNCTVGYVNFSGYCKGGGAVEKVAKAVANHGKIMELVLRGNNLNDSQAGVISERLRENRTVTELDLSDNIIGDKGAGWLVELIKGNEVLSHVLLGENNVTPGRKAEVVHSLLLNSQPLKLKRIYDPLSANSPGLTCVLLSGQDTTDPYGKVLNDISCRVLATCLESNSTVRTLRLPYNRITDEGAEFLSLIILQTQSLVTLDLRGNYITEEGVGCFSKVLKVNSSVKELDLCDQCPEPIPLSALKELNTQLLLNNEPLALKRLIPLVSIDDPSISCIDLAAFGKPYPSTTTCDLLIDALRGNTHVKEVNMSNCPMIGKIGLRAVLRFIAAGRPPVQIVRLRGMELDDGDCGMITELIKEGKRVKTIDLSGNTFTKVSEWTEAVLRDNDTLQEMIFEGGGDPGEVEQLQVALAINTQPLKLKEVILRVYENDPTLTEINLVEYDCRQHGASYQYGRRYGDKSAELLANALVGNKHVKKLDISNNSVGDKGAVALGEMLLTNRSVTTLNVSGNQITDAGLLAISDALLTNPCVSCIISDGNCSIKPSTRKQLNLATCHNNSLPADAYGVSSTLPPEVSYDQELAQAITADALSQYNKTVSLRATMSRHNEELYT